MKRPSKRKHHTLEHARQLSNHGAELLQNGQVQKALPVLEQAYELIPDDVPTAVNLGGACVLGKRYKRAIVVLERARDQEPDNEMIWINLGAAYLGNPILAQDEQQLDAIAAFERAIEINPVAQNVHYNLGLIHRDRGEIEQAAARFRQAIQSNPLDQHARNALQRLKGQDPAIE
ncbi:MAG: tetratricopeptide repeat protein [Anaerolineae bacterium]|nr:tetratricopeptide repeat protein [Anaerolineae bacterium]